MDSKYIKGLEIITKAMFDLQKIYDEADSRGLENLEASEAIYNLLDRLENTKDTIKYYTRETTEGYLEELPSGKFEIEPTEGGYSHSLSCGSALELYFEGEGWQPGRVEYMPDKGYYFYNIDMSNPTLYRGMKARFRK